MNDKKMTFKQFLSWANDRACDGYWDLNTAKLCIDIINSVKHVPLLKRKKAWIKIRDNMRIEENIVNPINIRINMIQFLID